MADEILTEAAPETTTEPAAAPAAEPAPAGFSQEQVNEIVSREKRKWQRQATTKGKEAPAPATTTNDNSELIEEVRALRQEGAELKFRNWSEENGLNPSQRKVAQSFADIADPESWGGVLEANKAILDALGTAPATTPAAAAPSPAPKHPMTVEAPIL